MCGGVYDEGSGVQGRRVRSQGLVNLQSYHCSIALLSPFSLGPQFPECPSGCVKLQSFVARVGTGLRATL